MRSLTRRADESTGYLALLAGNRDFRLLWSGQIVSLLGDWFNLIASASLVAMLTRSELAVGGLFVVRMLTPFLISPLAGVAADRYNRKRLLILTDLVRALAVLGFLAVREPRAIWLLYGLTGFQLALSGIFFPTRTAILPELVSSRELGAANALSGATWSVMLAIGAALGGVVSGTWGIYPAFVIDSVTFGLSALLIARIEYHPASQPETALGSLTDAFVEYFEGLRFLRRNADIFAISLHKAAMGFAVSGGLQVVQVALSERIFVIGEGGGISLGIMFAVVGVGTGLGPIAARWITGDHDGRLRIALLVAYLLAAVGLAVMAPLAGFGWVLFGLLLRALGGGVNWVFSNQLLLQLTPDRVRGRVFSTDFAFVTLAMASASAAGGWLLDSSSLGISGLLRLMMALSILPAGLWLLWMLFGAKSSMRRLPGTETGPMYPSGEGGARQPSDAGGFQEDARRP